MEEMLGRIEKIFKEEIEKVLGENEYEVAVEDYKETKFIAIRSYNKKNSFEPGLFIHVNKKTNEIKGFSRSENYREKAQEIKAAVKKALKKRS